MPSLQEYIALGEYETGLSQTIDDDEEEIIRLPLFLRLLAETDMECLEDRAAKFTSAEEIQILACHLAPTVCRAWKRKRRSTKRMVVKEQEEEEQADDDDDDEDTLMADAMSSGEEDEDRMDTREPTATQNDERNARIEVDSQETILHDTLEELFVKSQSETAVLSDDSILFQPTGGAILASLMHYAPQLHHSKVARLIVRSGRSEKRLLRYLAANCPAAQYTIETIMPNIMEKEVYVDLDATSMQYIAKPRSIRNTKQTRATMERLAKFPDNRLYSKALVWAMIRSQRCPNDTEGLKGIALLVTAVLSVEEQSCENLLERLSKETDERILFALGNKESLLNTVGEFLDVKTIDDEHLLKSVNLFVARNSDMMASRVWHNPAVILQQWKTGVVTLQSVETTLKEYLESTKLSESLVRLANAAEFVSIGVAMIDNPVPLVHAIALERMSLTSRVDSPLYLIRLLYCFAFQDKNPKSPFCFNPRNLPLRQIIHISHSLLWGDDLVAYVDAACPELKQISRHFSTCKVVDGNEQIEMKRSLYEAVKQSVCDLDDEGEYAETAFLDASSVLSEADVITTTVSAMMTRRGSLPPFVTYSMLYKDPLCILKCPLRFWNRASFRRLLITILQLLLEVNTATVAKDARTAELAKEYLLSRDLVVLQSVLSVATNKLSSDACQNCDMLLSLTRSLVVQNGGLVAALVRQDPPEEVLDFLVQWVPETINDGLHFQRFLLDKTHWSGASTRLKAADFCVRVAVAHGHRSMNVSSSMVATALSVLLSSFFIVLGPVGVSVDAARGGEDSNDATHTSRVVAFRLLRATQKTRVYRKALKAEIMPILQKLIGMCRGELIVGSLPSSVTGKQKAFLKDFGDAVAKTIDILGPGT